MKRWSKVKQTNKQTKTCSCGCDSEKAMATHSRVLSWKLPGMVEPGGLLSMRSHTVRSDWNDSAAAIAVDVTRDVSKVWCCKQQYSIGTRNVRSMNQGQLEVVKQDMAWVSINILRISEIKWTGMGEFNSDEHYIYYCGQESLRRSGVALIVNKRFWNAVLGGNLKNDKMISVPFQGKAFNITVIQVYVPTSKAEEAEVWPKRPSRTNTPKRCPLHHRGLEYKSRKSRDTWSNRQIWPWSTKWSRVKVNRILPREHTGHSKHPLPTTQEKMLHMDITNWSTWKSDWLYSLQPKMEDLYTVSKNKTRSRLWIRSWTPCCQIQI